MAAFPTKTRDIHSHHFDSTKWNDFPFREDDIIVATAYKSGTTWTQNILMHLLYQNREIPENSAMIAPWLDLRVPPIEVQLPFLTALTDRRQLKTHLRMDALNFSPKAKYLYIGRDGRDCYFSFVNHYRNVNDLWYTAINESPGKSADIPCFAYS
jgi:aryl sulfotransferase